jgi:ribosomal protein L24
MATLVAPPLQAQAQTAQAQQGNPSTARNVGTVKSINGQTLVLKSDSGPEVNVSLSDGTRIVRLAPGQADLKSATPMTASEIQVGDRVLVRGKPGDNDALVATSIVVMKQTDVAQKQQHDREDWQKRGAGGIVSAIDPASGTITVSVTPTVSIAVKTSKDTGFLRYAPNSIKFADAQKGTLDQIKTGDQLRARGNRSADGKELTAEEVISGSFRNIAGTVTSVDAANNAITVKDILAKKSVTVKFNPDSQLRKLAPQMAQGLARFLKSSASAGRSGPSGANQPAGDSGSPAGAGPAAGAPAGAGARPGGGPDFQQMLSRIPSVKLEELQKEDAVMIVAMPGANPGEATAVTLLGGVEPILTASPDGMSAAALFSGWNLGAPAGDAGPQ